MVVEFAQNRIQMLVISSNIPLFTVVKSHMSANYAVMQQMSRIISGVMNGCTMGKNLINVTNVIIPRCIKLISVHT